MVAVHRARQTLDTLAVGLPFLWAGLVAGLSFVEAPLKFQAPGITLELGIGIGRLVFQALNRIELLLGAGLAALAVATAMAGVSRYLVLGVGAILGAQTLWLLPVLDARAVQLLAGAALAPSAHHILFIALESLKLLLLLALPFTLRSQPRELAPGAFAARD